MSDHRPARAETAFRALVVFLLVAFVVLGVASVVTAVWP